MASVETGESDRIEMVTSLVEAFEAIELAGIESLDALAARLAERQKVLDQLQKVDVSGFSEDLRADLRTRLERLRERDCEVSTALIQAHERTRQALTDLGLRRTASRGYANAGAGANSKERVPP